MPFSKASSSVSKDDAESCARFVWNHAINVPHRDDEQTMSLKCPGLHLHCRAASLKHFSALPANDSGCSLVYTNKVLRVHTLTHNHTTQ
jgi:hypothetical protein